MKPGKIFFVTGLLLMAFFSGKAQDDAWTVPTKLKVGVFAPLYLDSVFSGTYYRYGKKFPRFVVQGLDFIQGAQIALDSLPLSNVKIEAHFFDSKSASEPVDSMISRHKLDSLQLIIGSVKDDEFQALARFARDKNIPFISATHPNDGGITANPNLVIVTSTLKAHCEAIFSYLLLSHGNSNILHVRKAGQQEDRVAGYFNAINKPDGKALVPIKTINIDSNFYLITKNLDSTHENIIIGGSLDESFAHSVAYTLVQHRKKYNITLIGMPNWDGFGTFTGNRREKFTDFPIYFTSPYFNAKWDNYSKIIQQSYLTRYKGKPSEYAYKGFETMAVFVKLLSRYPHDLLGHLNDYASKIFSDYNFKPVYLSKNKENPDYFENKHLYFLKKLNGVVSKAW